MALDVSDVPGGDLKLFVVSLLCKYVEQEIGLHTTVNSYLESRYPTQDARDTLYTDLMVLTVDVAMKLCGRLGSKETVNRFAESPCLSAVPDVTYFEGPGTPLLVHHLQLGNLAFEQSAYLSGGEPAVHILKELERKLIQFERPKQCVVSYHLAGLKCGQQLPPFGVHIVAGAQEVLHAFLIGHSLLRLREWPGVPDTLDQSAVILALDPPWLLKLLRPRVMVAVRDEDMHPFEWARLYLDYKHTHCPNPMQVLRSIEGAAAQRSVNLKRTIDMINSTVGRHGVRGKYYKEGCYLPEDSERISKPMRGILELIAQAGPAFRGQLQAGWGELS